MKQSFDKILVWTLTLFTAGAVITAWLQLRYAAAEAAFQTSLEAPRTFRAHIHLAVPGVHEKAIADARFQAFIIGLVITGVLAAVLLVLVALRRSKRLATVVIEEAI